MGAKERQAKAEGALHDQTNLLPRTQLVFVFGTLALTLLVCMLDQNGVSTALPTLAQDLHAESTVSWAGTSSLIANTTFQTLYGRLSDIFGRKAVYLGAIALLVLADLLCGLSQSAAMFYVFRGVAGIAGGGITNLAMIVVSDIVTLEQRGKYLGILGSMVGLGNVVGPFLAAAFAETVTWRAFFYTLAPTGAVVWATTFFFLPSKPSATTMKAGFKKIDYAGALSSSVAVIFLLIPISGGGAYFRWDSPMVISMLVIGSCFLVLFVIVEKKFAILPMMPVQIFESPVVVVMLVQTFLLGAVYQSFLYYVPMYLQNAHQYSAIKSAAIYTSMVGTQTVFSVLSGQYISRLKRYGEVIRLGFAAWTLGSGLTLLFGRHSGVGVIIAPLIIIGVGVGCVFQPTLVALQAHSPKSRRAVIISNRNFFRAAGGACGLAVSAAVLQTSLRSHLPPEYKYLAHQTYALPKQLPAADRDAVLDAYMAASHAVFIMQVPLVGLCLIGTLFVKDRGLESPEERAEKEKNTPGALEAQPAVRAHASITGEGDRQAGTPLETPEMTDGASTDEPAKE